MMHPFQGILFSPPSSYVLFFWPTCVAENPQVIVGQTQARCDSCRKAGLENRITQKDQLVDCRTEARGYSAMQSTRLMLVDLVMKNAERTRSVYVCT